MESLVENIKKDGSDISIVGHNIVYPSKVVVKVASRKAIFEPKEALEEILYDREIDLSAWGKLYKTELFSDIRYPKGRLFEDTATTYKLFEKASKISVLNEAKLNYVINQASITRRPFSEEKYELIENTKEMAAHISNKYPDLKKACNRRVMWAYLSTLTQLATSKNPSKKDVKTVMSYIAKNRKEVLADRAISKRDRFALIISKFGFGVFRRIWRINIKIRG